MKKLSVITIVTLATTFCGFASAEGFSMHQWLLDAGLQPGILMLLSFCLVGIGQARRQLHQQTSAQA